MIKRNGSKPKKEISDLIGTICEEDPQEVVFDSMIRLWIERKIPYSELIRYYPDYDDSMPKRLSKIFA